MTAISKLDQPKEERITNVLNAINSGIESHGWLRGIKAELRDDQWLSSITVKTVENNDIIATTHLEFIGKLARENFLGYYVRSENNNVELIIH